MEAVAHAVAILLTIPLLAAEFVEMHKPFIAEGQATSEQFTADSVMTSTYEPIAWYRFEQATVKDPTAAAIDSSPRNSSLQLPKNDSVTAAFPCPQKAGPVGNYLSFNDPACKTHVVHSVRNSKSWGARSMVNLSNSEGLTIEFLLKPLDGFLRGGETELIGMIGPGDGGPAPMFSISYNGLSFHAPTQPQPGSSGAPNDVVSIKFHGQGVLASDYLWCQSCKLPRPNETSSLSHGWHHFVLVKDGRSGNQSVWIDGNCTAEMHVPGNATGRVMAPMHAVVIDVRNPVALTAALDEIAIFDRALPPSMIYQHYTEALVHHKPYSMTDLQLPVPPPSLFPKPNESDYYDLNEFAIGTVLPSPDGDNNTVGATMSCLDQMSFVAGPRYNASAINEYSIPFHFNWMDVHYMAGATDPALKRFNTEYTIALQSTLAARWRYGISLWGLRVSPPNFTFPDDRPLTNQTIQLANAHPDWPVHLVFSGIPASADGKSQLHNQSLPDGCFLQDARGEFIDVTGAPIRPIHPGKPAIKNLRPLSKIEAEAQGCPDSLFARDGESMRDYIFKPLSKRLKRPIDIINVDGEVFVSLDTPAESYNFSSDPTVRKDFETSGAPNWETYWSIWRVRITNAVHDVFMKDAELSQTVLKGTKFTMYQVQGTNPYFGNWTITREIMTPMANAQTGKQSFFSTLDFYLQNPGEWFTGGGPDHGIEWTQTTREAEIAKGDTLFSPFVSPGWSGKAERNLRPAMWLGILKILSAWGAEFFYTGFFNVHFDSHRQMPDAKQWCWQGMMPAYAQAMMTQYADFVFKGELLVADENTTFAMGPTLRGESPLLWAGKPNILCVARKLGGAYLITLSVERLSNAKFNIATQTADKGGVYWDAAVSLPGVVSTLSTPIKLRARLQGSVYVWRNDTTSETPVVYQLDTWHESTHPMHWSTATIEIEAETFDGHLHSGARLIHTQFNEEGFVTFVDLQAAAAGSEPICFSSNSHLSISSRTEIIVSIYARHGTVAINGNLASPCNNQTHDDWGWYEAAVVARDQFCLTGDAEVDRISVVPAALP